MPEQFQAASGRPVDVGLGRASLAPPRWPPSCSGSTRWGARAPTATPGGAAGRPVATLAAEPLLLAEEQRAPEFNQFVIELCRSVGFVPSLYRGTVESIRAAADLVAQRRCVLCAPSRACRPRGDRVAASGRAVVPLSVVGAVAGGRLLGARQTLVRAARTLSQQLGWLELRWRADRDEGVLSAFVMSRAPIRALPAPPGTVSWGWDNG